MSAYGPLLAVLLALLAGLAIGKAWERYKLRDGKWFDRRRAGESRHYMLGLNFLVANQVDLAIEELGRAASLDPDALEVHMVLGNLYREKGQVGKAITVHQTLLQRPRLTRLEHGFEYARRLGAPLRAIAGAGHLVISERPEELAALVEEFLDRVGEVDELPLEPEALG